MRLIKIDNLLSKNEFFHIAKANISESSYLSPHSHDFPELFWVEKGSGNHKFNSKEHKIKVGDLIMIRPEDTHSFCTENNEELIIVNLAFKREVMENLRKRYFKNQNLFWPKKQDAPQPVSITCKTLKWLELETELLFNNKSSLFILERFLLNLYYEISTQSKKEKKSSLPGWLEKACLEMEEKENFSLGPIGLAKLSNKCPEHVARVMKSLTGQTPSEFINKIRMSYASKQLIMTEEPIIEIALDCGFDSLGHFYQCFKKHFNSSPAKFRTQNKRVV